MSDKTETKSRDIPANKVRREKYASDEDYRNRVREIERKQYRDRNPEFKPKGFGDQAGRATVFAETKSVGADGEFSRRRCLTVGQMADFIGVVPKVMNGWIVNGKFPRPEHTSEEGHYVFLVPEANALAAVMNRMLSDRGTFRATDTDIILELHKVALASRR